MRDCLDRVERVEMVELEGVDAALSRSGTASRARDGDVLSDGELGRCSGEVTLLARGLLFVSIPALEYVLSPKVVRTQGHGCWKAYF